ncbi:MAG: hypothetical protein AAGI69_14505 [Cyanobacteria bacterium P01_H01_bin.21]
MKQTHLEMQKEIQRIEKEIRKIEISEHMQAYRHIQQLSLTNYAFRESYKEMMNCLDNYLDAVLDENYKHQIFWFHYQTPEKEVYRLFLNFVSSAKTLVDHTRRMKDTLYRGCSFEVKYQEKIEGELASNPLNLFVNRLRNFMVHYRFPYISWQLKASPTETRMRLIISKPDLIGASFDWGKGAKAYIEAQEDPIFMDSLIEKYYLLIDNFHLWLSGCQKEMHQSEYSWMLDELQSLYQELGRLKHLQALRSRKQIF